jgi:hypothetical protein
MQNAVRVMPWSGDDAPVREKLWRLMVDQGLSPYSWSNGPHDVYGAHSHTYDKVIYVVSGSIAFGLPAQDRNLILNDGDRLDLPHGTVHDALVGPDGVVCLEGHREYRTPRSGEFFFSDSVSPGSMLGYIIPSPGG